MYETLCSKNKQDLYPQDCDTNDLTYFGEIRTVYFIFSSVYRLNVAGFDQSDKCGFGSETMLDIYLYYKYIYTQYNCELKTCIKDFFNPLKKCCLISVKIHTICPRSHDPFHIFTYNIKWSKTFWTYSKLCKNTYKKEINLLRIIFYTEY